MQKFTQKYKNRKMWKKSKFHTKISKKITIEFVETTAEMDTSLVLARLNAYRRNLFAG